MQVHKDMKCISICAFVLTSSFFGKRISGKGLAWNVDFYKIIIRKNAE